MAIANPPLDETEVAPLLSYAPRVVEAILRQWWLSVAIVAITIAALVAPTLLSPDTYTSSATVYSRSIEPDSRFLRSLIAAYGVQASASYVGERSPVNLWAVSSTPDGAQRLATEAIEKAQQALQSDEPNYEQRLAFAQTRYDAITEFAIDTIDTTLARMILQEIALAEAAFADSHELPLRVVIAPTHPKNPDARAYISKVIQGAVLGILAALVVVVTPFAFSSIRRSTR